METILKCTECNQALAIVREPKGMTKAGKPTKTIVDVLVCKNCGKRYDGRAEKGTDK